jgi:hypothetical protein
VSKEEDRVVIGKTTSCYDPSCNGWLVDSFSGKYFIRCTDPKHDQGQNEKVGVEERAAKPIIIPTTNRQDMTYAATKINNNANGALNNLNDSRRNK